MGLLWGLELRFLSQKFLIRKKTTRFQRVFVFSLLLTITAVLETGSAFAVVLPGPADINRIAPIQSGIPPPPSSDGKNITIPPSPASGSPVPENAKNIHLILRGFWFDDVTVFNVNQMKPLYAAYVGKDVTLDIAWKVADALTEMYRQKGYFLSRAFVPAQEASNGVLKIQAVEGYIGEVTLTGTAPASSVISQAIAAIKAERPARLQTLERQLLLLNDLPGLSFQSTLAPSQEQDEATARLILVAAETKGVTTLGVNNSGSRYIGPYEVSAEWSGSLVPLQQTDLSILSAPALSSTGGRFYSVNATQKIMISTAAALDATAGYSNALPGFTLKPENITSQSDNGGIGLSYHLIRQREENLTTRFSMDFRDSDINVLDTVLSRDRIRAAQWGVNADNTDRWSGHNYFDVELRRGLPVLGSSRASDTDISKPDVHPDFTKLQLNYTRLQGLTKDWNSSLTLTGQRASGALYSSEEFGYGGTAIGRAYDTSEISGDDGVSGSLELHYQGLPQWQQIAVTPYTFYDIGKVWDLYPNAPEEISGASAGPGITVLRGGLSGNFYMAYPLTKEIDLPLYTMNHRTPRYAFQLTDKF
jgi:hemolysin activation/secretion protein